MYFDLLLYPLMVVVWFVANVAVRQKSHAIDLVLRLVALGRVPK